MGQYTQDELMFNDKLASRHRYNTRGFKSEPLVLKPGSSNTSTAENTKSVTKNFSTDVVSYASTFIGIMYKFGEESRENGFDCSGLSMTVMQRFGITLPRTANDQAVSKLGTTIYSNDTGKPTKDEKLKWKAGDLLFFRHSAKLKYHHVSIYIGNNKMIHAPHSGDHVRIAEVYTPQLVKRYIEE